MSPRPFFRFYGGKWRAAPRYPSPEFDMIIEPFAGAAGYALRHHTKKVILVEKDATIAALWRWLISSTPDDVRAIPCVESLDELPAWVPLGARHLVGFSFNDATVAPCRRLSAGRKKLASMGRHYEGWNEARRERTASHVGLIKHWELIEGGYEGAPDEMATWFIDPPYQVAGLHYKCSSRDIDYSALGAWCAQRRGQVVVCEAESATWLPFRQLPGGPIKSFGAAGANRQSREAIWTGP